MSTSSQTTTLQEETLTNLETHLVDLIGHVWENE
jgi:hypothetical protein